MNLLITRRPQKQLLSVLWLFPLFALSLEARQVLSVETKDGWRTGSPREEICPDFSYEASGGRSGRGALVITADQRKGLDGFWTKTFNIQGGKHYHFRAYRKTTSVKVVRRSAVVKLTWQDDKGKLVPTDRPVVDFYRRPGSTSYARPEYPTDRNPSADGWTEVSDTYRAPVGATRAVVELHLRWAPQVRIDWSDISLTKTAKPSGRKVRLATVHFRPRGGKTPADNCRLFAPLIEQAARKKADLVLLPETLTFYGLGVKYADVAEPIPGPSTKYFGKLAKQHDLYIVAGLIERDGHLIYNVGVLIGPDGGIVGKYRKVCLPRGEIEGGIAPGHEYPVFKTRFGKVGMMICYDGFFPEVARELANGGAEIIAWPVWGCNPLLARARACENHVYLMSSTYTDADSKWIVSAIFDHTGKAIVSAKEWSEVVVTEVDLDQRTQWSGIGDFKAELLRHRPPSTIKRKGLTIKSSSPK